jgi:serine/threonine protein kinase/tetratricopeptide (TPR) repeat protein
MDLVFQYLPYVVGAAVLVFAYQKLAASLKIRVPQLTLDDLARRILGPGYATKKIASQAAREKKKGNYLQAGKLLEDAEMLQQAVDTYLEGNETMAAAFLLERMGKLDRAAEKFLEAGDYKKAAEVYANSGKPAKAAALYEQKGNNLEAARLYAKAASWDKAADLYVKSGYPLKAAEAFEKKGDFLKAAESYEKHFMENVTFSTTYSGAPPSAEQKNALLSGRLFIKAGAPQRAREIYLRGSFFKEAASVCLTLGEFARAAEYFLRAEDLKSAADAYEKGGDSVKAANYRGEVAFKAGQLAEAAALFQRGQDYQRAAELFEQIGMLKEAAGAYEEASSFSAAASVYMRAGEKARAASCYERGGEYETAAKLYEEVGSGAKAAELYEKAGLTFKSGESAARAGQGPKAIALLQRVPPGDENYAAATELLAELFLKAGMHGLAVERLQKALEGKPVAASNLNLYYWLGLAQEAGKNRDAALAIYKKVLAEDFEYRDVARRAKALESAPVAAPPAAPRSSDAPARALAPGAVTAQMLHERGVSTLQICPVCARCYDHTVGACADDSARLKTPRVVPYVLLERYRLVRVLGEGGMGMVFEAHDQRLDRSVAIKIVRPEDVGNPAALSRLEREARLVAKLKHPGVIGIYDSGELLDGSAFLVMELLEGRDLAGVIAAYGRGRPSQVASLLRQAGSALTAAHKLGVIHRDIKPQNIFLVNGEYGFQVKMLDFGIAKSLSVDAAVTQSGMIVGTPAYMSPEQVRNAPLDARSDLYSLAVVGFEALTGSRAVRDGDLASLLMSVLNEPAPRVSSRLPKAPKEIEDAFAWAFAKDPNARPRDVETWVSSVADLLECYSVSVEGWPDPLPAPGATRAALAKAIHDRSTTVEPRPERPAAPPAAARPTAAPATPAAATPAAAMPAAGAKPPRFVRGEEIGRGPLGIVHRGQDQSDSRSVAMRFLPREALSPDGSLQALVADLKAAASLSHPNVVRVLGLVELGGQRCVLSELVQGKSLAAVLKPGQKMSVPTVQGVARFLAQALAAIHARGLVHGSIRPSNVMSAGGVVKLADLGLGRLFQKLVPADQYRAPENRLDAAGDVYAFGAVLYELLTGTVPRPGPSQPIAGVPEPLDRIVRRCLDPRPEARFARGEEIAQQLGAGARQA